MLEILIQMVFQTLELQPYFLEVVQVSEVSVFFPMLFQSLGLGLAF